MSLNLGPVMAMTAGQDVRVCTIFQGQAATVYGLRCRDVPKTQGIIPFPSRLWEASHKPLELWHPMAKAVKPGTE